jgi:Holliday junction resolvase-like predicted endonuclease
MSQWQVGVAAEAFAAAQFARFGCDVSVQYGADQPEYDLVIVRGERILKISVKGSQDGGWGLTQSQLRDADYQQAADLWLKRHGSRTVMCFVQFRDTADTELPRMYLATPSEVAAWLKAAAKGRGDTILHEHHAWTDKAAAAGTVDAIPDTWRFGRSRLESLFTAV